MRSVPIPGVTRRGDMLGFDSGQRAAADRRAARCASSTAALTRTTLARRARFPLSCARGRLVRCVLPAAAPATGAWSRLRKAPDDRAQPAGITKTYRVGKSFGGAGATLHALRGVDLEVRNGETLGLVGESGCGKTTLARLILGIEAPTTGTVILGRQVDRRTPPARARAAVQPVFQDPMRRSIRACGSPPSWPRRSRCAASERRARRERVRPC